MSISISCIGLKKHESFGDIETLMKLKEQGLTRAIGVANSTWCAVLKTAVEEIKAPIACNQVEYHVSSTKTR